MQIWRTILAVPLLLVYACIKIGGGSHRAVGETKTHDVGSAVAEGGSSRIRTDMDEGAVEPQSVRSVTYRDGALSVTIPMDDRDGRSGATPTPLPGQPTMVPHGTDPTPVDPTPGGSVGARRDW